jgi:hypothetical protein
VIVAPADKEGSPPPVGFNVKIFPFSRMAETSVGSEKPLVRLPPSSGFNVRMLPSSRITETSVGKDKGRPVEILPSTGLRVTGLPSARVIVAPVGSGKSPSGLESVTGLPSAKVIVASSEMSGRPVCSPMADKPLVMSPTREERVITAPSARVIGVLERSGTPVGWTKDGMVTTFPSPRVIDTLGRSVGATVGRSTEAERVKTPPSAKVTGVPGS